MPENEIPPAMRVDIYCALAAAAVVVATAVTAAAVTCADTVAAAADEEKDHDKDPGAITAEISVTHSVDLLSPSTEAELFWLFRRSTVHIMPRRRGRSQIFNKNVIDFP